MLDAGGGGAKLGFVADTVAKGPGAGFVSTRTRFFVEPDEAQRLIDGLKQALEKLLETKRTAERITAANSLGKTSTAVSPPSPSARPRVTRKAATDGPT
ncbi:hypothetical protein AB0I60_15860 [Actinosynnema sp. NPDC050436]|uniref:hypothetical protein n=1 Tax=Actinosynnema sp. NPDC050436 TaxID=3155659 RepID=UPI0033EB227C